MAAPRPKGFTSVMAGRIEPPDALDFMWIPPGQRSGLTKPTDRARFAPDGQS